MAKPLLGKTVLFFLLFVPASSLFSRVAPEPCDGVALKIEISRSAAFPGKGNIEAVVTGAEKPIHYIFYKSSGQLLSKDVTSNKVKDVDPGTYYCSIVDGRGCNKKTEFKIE